MKKLNPMWKNRWEINLGMRYGYSYQNVLKCGHMVMMPRRELNKKMKKYWNILKKIIRHLN